MVSLKRISAFFLSSFSLLWLVSQAWSASPSLGSISPRGGQRGTEMEIILSGGRLADGKELLFYKPGIQVTKVVAVNDGQVKATVKIAPDAEMGEYAVRLRTASGISEMRTFYVGPYPAIEEKEPNSEFLTPQKIPLQTTVVGVANNEDVDYFVVEMKKGQRLSAEVEGMRLGTTLFDPYVAILDSKRFEMSSRDDTPLAGQDCFASIVAPADGNYIVQVRESAYAGNGACSYRLHVGSFPRPTAIYPVGGKAGEEVEFTCLGDPIGSFKQKVKLPLAASNGFKVFPHDAGGVTPSGMPFRVSQEGNTLEVEPNDTPDKATPGAFPTVFNGIIQANADVDTFKFKGIKGKAFDVECFARRIGSQLDPVMTLSIAGGGAVASNDDSGGPDSNFRVTLDDKDYILTITDHLKKGGPDYVYRVEFNPVTPYTVTSLPRVEQFSQERQAIAIHKGNRYAALMTASRREFGGDLKLIAENLPPGITMDVDTISNGLDTFAVVFEAKADAQPAGSYAAIKAVPTDPKVIAKPLFSQTADLIYGAPGQSVYWRYEIDRLGIALAEPAPFSIRVVEPKVPLVQNGRMNLKIAVERRDGFKGAITVYPVYNPPGIGSASAITIAENQTEGLFPINASGGAPVRKWKTAFNALGNGPSGPMWVSSQLFTLEVAPPFFQFALERGSVEQGKTTEILCKVTQTTPFEGSAKVQLVGLPPRVVTPILEITAQTKEILFKIDTEKTAQPGQHRNLFCTAVVMKNGEEVVHQVGSTELRVDVPPPPKVVANAPTPMAKPGPMPKVEPAKPMEKRLSRLEKLRLEQEEREKAAKVGGEKK
ncbi:MAG: peptidase [Gemmataceae bacterium]|nr:peptidase [Gemmataceae bacterium]